MSCKIKKIGNKEFIATLKKENITSLICSPKHLAKSSKTNARICSNYDGVICKYLKIVDYNGVSTIALLIKIDICCKINVVMSSLDIFYSKIARFFKFQQRLVEDSIANGKSIP